MNELPEYLQNLRHTFPLDDQGTLAFISKLIEMKIIPFDVIRTVSTDPLIYGCVGVDEKFYHKQVRLKNIKDLVFFNTDEFAFLPKVGTIVGYQNGRAVVHCEEYNVFYGWLYPEDYEVIDVYQHTTYVLSIN